MDQSFLFKKYSIWVRVLSIKRVIFGILIFLKLWFKSAMKESTPWTLQKTYMSHYGKGLKPLPFKKHNAKLAILCCSISLMLTLSDNIELLVTTYVFLWGISLYFALLAFIKHFPDTFQMLRKRFAGKNDFLLSAPSYQLRIGKQYLTVTDVTNDTAFLQVRLSRIKSVQRNPMKKIFLGVYSEEICVLCDDEDTYLLAPEALSDCEINLLNERVLKNNFF